MKSLLLVAAMLMALLSTVCLGQTARHLEIEISSKKPVPSVTVVIDGKSYKMTQTEFKRRIVDGDVVTQKPGTGTLVGDGQILRAMKVGQDEIGFTPDESSLTPEGKIAANKAWSKTTDVWLGDESGSEDFVWGDVHIAVPRPPALTVTYQAGKPVVEGVEGYKAWYDTWLLPYTDRPCDFSRSPAEMPVADWRNAKRWAYYSKTGKMPVFTPPFPNSPGGNSRAAIG